MSENDGWVANLPMTYSSLWLFESSQRLGLTQLPQESILLGIACQMWGYFLAPALPWSITGTGISRSLDCPERALSAGIQLR